MGKFKNIVEKTKSSREELYQLPFLSRYYSETKSFTLKDHALFLAQLAAIHEALESVVKKNICMQDMPLRIQDLYFKSYYAKRDLEFIKPYIKENNIKVLPATELYVNELHELALKSRDKEIFAHFLVHALANLFDAASLRKSVQEFYSRVIPNYKQDNYGVTYYCFREALPREFEEWFDKTVIEEPEMEKNLLQAYQRQKEIYTQLETARNEVSAPKQQHSSCCRFFTAATVAGVAAAALVETYRLTC